MISLSRRKRVAILMAALSALLAVWLIFSRGYQETPSQYVNSLLAVRGFRHNALELAPGDTKDYVVEVGEEFKVTWQIQNITEDAQLLYSGPAGIGAGLVTIPFENIASAGGAQFLEFTPTQTGTATFTLTITGPGLDGVYTIPSALTVHITP